MTTIPMPIGDPTRPWNGACSDCKQFCAGHYLKPQEALQTSSTIFNPPSAVILEASKAGILNESDIENLARKVLLPVEDETTSRLTWQSCRTWDTFREACIVATT